MGRGGGGEYATARNKPLVVFSKTTARSDLMTTMESFTVLYLMRCITARFLAVLLFL